MDRTYFFSQNRDGVGYLKSSDLMLFEISTILQYITFREHNYISRYQGCYF